jgi:hypothetical protein
VRRLIGVDVCRFGKSACGAERKCRQAHFATALGGIPERNYALDKVRLAAHINRTGAYDQLDRSPDFESGGCGFEPHRAGHAEFI